MELESLEGEGETSERSEGVRLLLLVVVSIGSAGNRLLSGAGLAIGCASEVRDVSDSKDQGFGGSSAPGDALVAMGSASSCGERQKQMLEYVAVWESGEMTLCWRKRVSEESRFED